ncbi:hypothetical protein GOBAR_AA18945 [Gossypium barbadense]|uniref:Uncharacterized protein n=1 Tax=Gossypium barbadense TaxID=3634 RepID=A0A2P5XEF0_GOSBA|nr:hypothetical protein GOBAR_AA18945 [Gossypium barbadense]
MGVQCSHTVVSLYRSQVPPRRGQIKAQIFESMVKAIASAASKAMGKNKGEGGGSASTTITPKQMVTSLRGANMSA